MADVWSYRECIPCYRKKTSCRLIGRHSSINANHDLLQSHRPHKTIAEQSAKEAAAVSAEEEKNGSSAASGGTGKEISIEEFWRPTGHGVAFWETCGVR